MKVKTLIKQLKTFDQNLDCMVWENLEFPGIGHPVTNIFATGFIGADGEEIATVMISAQDISFDE